MTPTMQQSESRRARTLQTLRGTVIVSCQAGEESPLNSPHMIAALASSAEMGGAQGFRVDGPVNIAAVRASSALPIIGINKQWEEGCDVYITPSLESALGAVHAGADMIAADGSDRSRAGGQSLADIVAGLHDHDVPVMADVASVAEAEFAIGAGVDLIATTMAGYTDDTRHLNNGEPAYELIAHLQGLAVPVVAEGRIWSPEQMLRCFELGAHAVVIGSAITVPQLIARRFVAAAASRAKEDQ